MYWKLFQNEGGIRDCFKMKECIGIFSKIKECIRNYSKMKECIGSCSKMKKCLLPGMADGDYWVGWDGSTIWKLSRDYPET